MRHRVVWYVGLKSMVFWDTAPCGLVCGYQDYGVQNATLCGLICGFEGDGVLGCDTMFFLVYRYQDYGVPGCDTMFFGMWVSILWCSRMWHHVAWYTGIKIMVFWFVALCTFIGRCHDNGILGCDTMFFWYVGLLIGEDSIASNFRVGE
jgi:hypothetical protein